MMASCVRPHLWMASFRFVRHPSFRSFAIEKALEIEFLLISKAFSVLTLYLRFQPDELQFAETGCPSLKASGCLPLWFRRGGHGGVCRASSYCDAGLPWERIG